MIQLGIAAFFHDSAACIVKDGKVIGAVEEERFTEVKHDYSFPYNSISWLLKENNLKLNDIDEVCWYENPKIKRDRVLSIFNKRWFKTLNLRINYLLSYNKNNPIKILKKLGYNGPIKYTEHHLSHAAFSYFTSPFNEAAILTVDGVGEWETITISYGKGNKINKKFSIDYPNSLGMLYSTITAYLGFKPNEGEYKVMGLAPYGNSKKYITKLRKVFKNTSNKFTIDQKYFDWEYSNKKMFNKYLFRLLGILPRLPEEEVTQEHKDLAASLQKVYEEQFLKLVNTASKLTKSDNLVLGGGCAYNGVANSKAYKYFKHIHIPFAPSDAGSAIGTCLFNYEGDKKGNTDPFLGPEYSDKEVKKELNKFKNIKYLKLSEEKIIQKTASLINSGNIVAWFQGKMEFGARALGNRSILATPLDSKMRTKLNYVIKKREGFRPFAPSVMKGEDTKWFKVYEDIPYMNQVVQAKNKDKFPSATHVDGSCRVHTVTFNQNKKYYKLLKELKNISKYGVVLNTSFNLKDQTITMTPKQAIQRYINSDIDYLIINNYLIYN
jgi:carbamoyltransferase